MTTQDRLFNLLPVAYRQRDLEQGSSLQMLLRVIAEQVDLVESDIAQLYENWFIETCAQWAVPYIGDLIGYRPVRSAAETTDDNPASDKILFPRREVANTLGYRKRKGTLALLEEIAFATAGWPALPVEFHRYLGVTQNLQHPREDRGRTIDLRKVAQLSLLGTAFDKASHTLEVRSPNYASSPGRYTIASLGLFVWRLRVYQVDRTPAYRVDDAGEHCYTFSILGNDVALYTHDASSSSTRRGREAIPDQLDLPIPIRRRAFAEQRRDEWRASAKYYGAGKSLAIWVAGWAEHDGSLPVPRDKILPADLTDWRYRPRAGHIAVDPELGRIAFPPGELPKGEVWTSYCYAFGADLGGGPYSRSTMTSADHARFYLVGQGQDFSKLRHAVEKWHEDKPEHAIIEISDSGVYEEELRLHLGKGQALELRAADGARPVIYAPAWRASRPEAITISGTESSDVTLDGLLVTGRGIEVRGPLGALTLRNCTLVPGWALHADCKPRHVNEPSLLLDNAATRVRIEQSIVGPIHVTTATDQIDPLQLEISDSVVDATEMQTAALGAPERERAWLALTIRRSTVLGDIEVHAIALAENTLFMGQVHVARRQSGFMRFCYVAPGSRTPIRYRCQPDLVEQHARSQTRPEHLAHTDREALLREEVFRVEPAFRSTRYGDAHYCRLADSCAPEIKAGGDDRSEMGVFYKLHQPQREANLRGRLEEFTPAGIDARILFAD